MVSVKNCSIDDGLLEALGMKKIECNDHNRKSLIEESLKDILKNPMLTTKDVGWNDMCLCKSQTMFYLGYGRFLQKTETNGYLLSIYGAYDTLFNGHLLRGYSVTYDRDVIQVCGPLWLTVVYTVEDLKKLLDVLRFDYNKRAINKYFKSIQKI